jgi:hypothetical protein
MAYEQRELPRDSFCLRTFAMTDTLDIKRDVTLWLGIPKVRSDGSWECSYGFITAVEEYETLLPSNGTIRGIDGLQAIQLALVACREALAPFGERISWLGVPNYNGIYLSVIGFSVAMQRHLENVVERESSAIFEAMDDPSTREDALRRFGDRKRD